MGIVAMMHVITKSQAVPETATPGIVLHAIKTAAMLFGAISWGARLAPVTGMPCRRKEKKRKEKKRKEKKREEKKRERKKSKEGERERKGRERKNYAFRRQSNEKPSIITGWLQSQACHASFSWLSQLSSAHICNRVVQPYCTCANEPKQTLDSLSQVCHASFLGCLRCLLHKFAIELCHEIKTDAHQPATGMPCILSWLSQMPSAQVCHRIVS